MRSSKMIAADFLPNVIKMQNRFSGLLFSITCIIVWARGIKDEG